MRKAHLLAARSEYFYNRLSLDLPHLSVAILAIDAADVRARIIRQLEDLMIDKGEDIPSIPDEFEFPLAVLKGEACMPTLPLSQHLDDCRLADGTLAAELSKHRPLRDLVPKLRESYLTIWNFYREKSGPIPTVATVENHSPTQ